MSKERYISILIIVASLVLVIISIVFTNRMAHRLALEEQDRVQIWAEATELLIQAKENENIDFYSTIIKRNNSIPVYITDSAGRIVSSRNVKHPVADPTTLFGPIELKFQNENGQVIMQYIYYDESRLLRHLHHVPYYQFAFIFIFITVAVVLMIATHRNEQNRVWVGLSKETAHQLGTPISALMGWQELLAVNYPSDKLIPQMRSDILRLQTIANRFSKIGSEPDLQMTNIVPVLRNMVDYMRTRTSQKISITFTSPDEINVLLNVPLFDWVIENLIKNAIDAMDGRGNISICASSKDHIIVDVTDTGKGIDNYTLRKIFRPGFSTKKRGWGLGLSLSKRIIENYHGGKLFVKATEVGTGTTFRIELKQPKNS